MITPKDISSKKWFDSVFQNSECETILRNIIMLQQHVSPDEWTPFSWDDYVAFCTHNVTSDEKVVLNAFVNGGKPTMNTSVYLHEGWLSFSNNQYSFTQRMIDILGEHHRA